jgi:hypothetical protein
LDVNDVICGLALGNQVKPLSSSSSSSSSMLITIHDAAGEIGQQTSNDRCMQELRFGSVVNVTGKLDAFGSYRSRIGI